MSGVCDRGPRPQVIAIVGPTATGKSALAEELAVRLSTAVVSADSMQVYRGMDIGTAKTPADARRVPLYCVDLVDVAQSFSVAEYAPLAQACVDRLLAERGTALVCGGTGLYVRAALEHMSFPSGDQDNNPIRQRYTQLAQELGAEGLHRRLEELDPESAACIHPHNVRRVVRAFELYEQGLSYAQHHSSLHAYQERYPTAIFGLMMDREQLYGRINARVDTMVEEGLVQEVRALMEQGLADTLTSRQAIGYKEIVEALTDGGASQAAMDSALDCIKQRSRRYAKRQMTWFKSDPRVQWLDCSTIKTSQLADIVMEALDLKWGQ